MTDISIPPASQAEIAPSRSEIDPVSSEPELAATQIHAATVQGGDRCASCGVPLAADQRYCLECGQRRGDPRLPFMDAVVLMDAVQRPQQAPPPPPKKKRTSISPNAALIAGVGTLLLALGIGVLIGRSGSHEVASTAPAAPIVIHSGGGEEATTASKGKTTTGGGAASNAKTKKQKAEAQKAAEEHPAAEDVIKPTNGVELAKPKTQLGDPCSNSQAGCENGKFEGTFFE